MITTGAGSQGRPSRSEPARRPVGPQPARPARQWAPRGLRRPQARAEPLRGRLRRAVLVRGRVSRAPARAGVVPSASAPKRQALDRRSHHARVPAAGRFQRLFRGTPPGRYRVVAVYKGTRRTGRSPLTRGFASAPVLARRRPINPAGASCRSQEAPATSARSRARELLAAGRDVRRSTRCCTARRAGRRARGGGRRAHSRGCARRRRPRGACWTERAVVHLAAIVGDPACARDPEKSQARSTSARPGRSPTTPARPASSASCSRPPARTTGAWPTRRFPIDETAELAPVSLYAEQKVTVEQ